MQCTIYWTLTIPFPHSSCPIHHFQNSFDTIPHYSLGFRKGRKGLNLELTKQTSDGIAIAALDVVGWDGEAIHAEVGVVGMAAIVRDWGPEGAVAPGRPENTVEVASGSEVERS